MGTWEERLARAAEPFREALENEKSQRLWLTYGEQAAVKAGREAHDEAADFARQVEKLQKRCDQLTSRLQIQGRLRGREEQRADAWREAYEETDQHWESPREGAAVEKARRLQALRDTPTDGVAGSPDGRPDER